MRLKSPLLSLSSLILSFIRITKLFQNNSKLIIKFYSSKLNIRPYNKLDKEVIDFREYKEGLATQHNTKCFYY